MVKFGEGAMQNAGPAQESRRKESVEVAKERMMSDLPVKVREAIGDRKVLAIMHEGFQDDFARNIANDGRGTGRPNYHLWVIELEGGGKVYATRRPDHNSSFGKLDAMLRLHTEVEMAEPEEWVYSFDGANQVEITMPNTGEEYRGQKEVVELTEDRTLEALMQMLRSSVPGEQNRIVNETERFDA